jgi:hypothetical protein
MTEEDLASLLDERLSQIQMPEPQQGLTAEEVRQIIREEMEDEISPEPDDQPMLEPIPGDQDGVGCEDKLYTYPANDAGILYDFEIQSEVVQMNDFYTPGNPTILVLERAIQPNERSDYAFGWGSAWGIYTDRAGCENFDMIENAVSYAESRLDQGHAGIIVDFRDGKPLVIAMLKDLSEDEASRLWNMYISSRHDGADEVYPSDLLYADDMIYLQWPEGASLPERTRGKPTAMGKRCA